jgi:aspartyl-tRNA(Asn)/glutamyl-tRNA(Gln) amidotransferase subunit A
VPIAVKDLIEHAGRVTTCGSAFYRHDAAATATSLSRLIEAGAIVIGRTGLHEFAFGFSSENPHFGPVRNPWDPDTSCGGSSGGSGGAVAAGIVPIALGTDTGGSVRVPAALCGTYGLKVTHGRIPLDGVFPLVPTIDTVGPLADSVDNLELAYRVMSGDDGPRPEIRPLKIGVPQPWVSDAPSSDEVASAFAATRAVLEGLGHVVEDHEMPGVGPSHLVVWAIAGEVREVHREFRERGEPYGPDVAQRLADSEAVTDDELAEGRRWQERLRARFADAFDRFDLLVTPTVPVRSKTIGDEKIGELHYRVVLSWFSYVANHALIPAIALPLEGTGSPPLSLQAMAPPGGEGLLLAFAHQLEAGGISGFRPAVTGKKRPHGG